MKKGLVIFAAGVILLDGLTKLYHTGPTTLTVGIGIALAAYVLVTKKNLQSTILRRNAGWNQ